MGKKFCWIKNDQAVGFGIRVGKHGLLFAWHKIAKRPKFYHHVYAWWE